MNRLRAFNLTKLLAAASFMALSLLPAKAEYPEQNIRIIVPYAAGGFTDAFARIVAERLSPIMGKPVIVENRGGASGRLAHDYVAGSTPDGYTLVLDVVTLPTLMTFVEAGPPHRDMLKAFDMVAMLGSTTLVMNTPAERGFKDFKDFVAKIKAEPKKHSYGSSGTGTQAHVLSAQLVKATGLDIVHVPYRGGAPAMQDLLANQIAFLLDTPTTSLAPIQAGKITPMFVVYPTRIKQLPNVPTIEEVGYPQFRDQGTSTFLMAPAGTPKAVLEKLNSAFQRVRNDPSFLQRLDTIGLLPPPDKLTADGARDLAAKQIQAWDRAVQSIK